MAQIHAAAFVHDRGWSSDEFATLIAQPHTDLFSTLGGFALTRTLIGESELLTLAVSPDQQRRGIARALLTDWIAAKRQHAEIAFLDVAADNFAALGLYQNIGFTRTGLRKSYYARAQFPAVDAVMMTQALTRG
ncbi:GNAT family N-acetyltransferase [Sulfitobacter sp.]|uniref:GNAT family N-acetyltransferase n=1 Tax=Sulfitobacter sp. TaxID=1903071 RepID=UPI0030011B88